MMKKKAFVACRGGCRATADCTYGCVGCGVCVSVCPAEAISLAETKAAVVDFQKCTGCGACVGECPRSVIVLRAAGNPIAVACSNRDPGKIARDVCEVSCIACGVCRKVCPSGAAAIRENLCTMDEELCLSCGRCAVKCPRHAIADVRGILTE